MSTQTLSVLALAALLSPCVDAQIQRLRDVENSAKTNPSSEPHFFTRMGGHVYYKVVHSDYGAELFRTPLAGGKAELVRDIQPGPKGSLSYGLMATANRVYFLANDGTHGLEAWVSDGTRAGTQMLELAPGAASSNAAGFVEFGNRVFFSAEIPGRGLELCVTDGTPQGTRLFLDINPGAASSRAGGMTRIGSHLWFAADDGVHGSELWRTDGTPAGTSMLKDFTAHPWGGRPVEFLAVGSSVFFFASADGLSWSLFRSDGTARGTVEVRRFAASQPRFFTRTAYGMQRFGSGVVFVAQAQVGGPSEVWFSDGTPAGTRVAVAMAPERMIVAGASLYLYGTHSGLGVRDIFVSDGTAAGTRVLAPGQIYAAWDWCVSNNRLFLSAVSSLVDRELWVSDGTAAGTVLVRNIRPGPRNSSSPKFLTDLGAGRIVFAADDGENGEEVWMSDGTSQGTFLAGDAYPPAPGSPGSNPSNFFEHRGLTYFSATTAALGQELWRTDGTAAGTVLVNDFRPGPDPSSARVLGAVGDGLLVHAHGPRPITALWYTDGTAAGTRRLLNVTSGIWWRPTLQLGRRVVFTSSTVAAGAGVWVSDGTTAGTTMLLPFTAPRTVVRPVEFARIGNVAYFTLLLPGPQLELWRSDGTAAGTRLVRNLGRAHMSTRRQDLAAQLIAHRGQLLFNLLGELWASDGSAAGTRRIAAVGPTVYSSRSTSHIVGDWVFYAGMDGELWKTDGTPAGTALVKDIRPGSRGSMNAFSAAAIGRDLIVFAADDGTNGMELWRSDGTAAGTFILKTTPGGTSGGWPSGFQSLGSRYATFVASSTQHGRETWVTNGTVAGTFMLQDHWPGTGNGAFWSSSGLANGRLIGAANDGLHGSEPAMIDLAGFGVASSVARGQPCGVTAPTLEGTDAIMGGTLQITGRGAPAGTLGVLALSLIPTQPTLAGACELYVDPAAVFLVATSINPSRGAWSRSVRVAGTPNVLGLPVVFQAAFGPTAAPLGVDVTNSVIVVHGR